MKTAAVSIDVDEIHHYRSLHGLPASSVAAHAAFEVAVPRAVAWARRHGLPLTFFLVAEDLGQPDNRARMLDALDEGHAAESHSLRHRYDLVRLGRERIRDEVLGSFDVIEHSLRARPRGFRAPGYTLSDEVLDAVEEAGGAFDSSVLPSAPYYLAKSAVLAWMKIRGLTSSSILGTPEVLLAPTEPYRPGRWAKAGDRPLVEIPIRVTRFLRVPVIGTTVGLAGARGASTLVRSCGRPEVFNLELHAMDFLGADDGLSDLEPHEPGLTVPLARRMEALDATARALAADGYSFATLAAVADTLAARL